jgi:hypothetical protein
VALTVLQAVRLKISDVPTVADETLSFDGTATVFALSHANAVSGTAYVPLGGTAWTATGATFDPTGWVAFSGVGAAGSAFRVRYVHATFSDDEIGHFTAVGGDVLGAAVEACEALLFDAAKRASWSSPDGTQFSDTAAQAHLLALHERLKAEQREAAVTSGALESWSEQQEYY